MWKLCEQVKKQNPNELSKCYAVFVSNERRTVPLWRQKAGRGEDKLVVWVSHNFFLVFPLHNKISKHFPFPSATLSH